jgi:hypothetical protein
MLQHVGKMDELLYWQLFFLSSIIWASEEGNKLLYSLPQQKQCHPISSEGTWWWWKGV